MLYRLFQQVDSGSNSQTIDIRQDDTIELISVAVELTPDATQSAAAYIELSFLSTAQAGVNDTTGVIWTTRVKSPNAASALFTTVNQNIVVPMPSLPVSSGERLFLHLESTSGIVAAYVHIYTAKADLRPATRRR